MSFCPVCGKKSDGFCKECKPSDDLESKEILIRICTNCGKFFKNNKWHSYKFEEGLIKVAKDKIKNSVEIDTSELNFEKFNQKKPGLKINFDIKALKDNNLYLIPAKIHYTYCENCSKKQGKYFEGTLQLRNTNDEILDYVEDYIKKNNISIAEKNQRKNDYDLNLSDNRKLQNLAQNLKKNFGGNLKISIRQFTQDRLTSKQIYRVNALYEAPEYKKYDILKIENNLYFLTNVKKGISAIDLKNGRKTTLKKIENYTILEKKKTKITKVYPQLEVLETETYQSVPVKNFLINEKEKSKKEFKIGENVKIVCDEGIYYLLN